MARKKYRKSNKDYNFTYDDLVKMDEGGTIGNTPTYQSGKTASKLSSVPIIGMFAQAGTAVGNAFNQRDENGIAQGSDTSQAIGNFFDPVSVAEGLAEEGKTGQAALSALVPGAASIFGKRLNERRKQKLYNAQQGALNYNLAQNQLQQEGTPETFGATMRCGGNLKHMAAGGGIKNYLITSSGEQEISPDEVENVKKYLAYQKRLNDYYSNKYKTRISGLKKLGITTPEAYDEHIKKNPKDILEPEDYAALYKGSNFTPEEIAEYEPLRDKYFSVGQVKGIKEGNKSNVTDTAFAGRNLFAGLNLGFKQIPEEAPQQINTSPYSYEPYRGYSGISIGYSMDKTGGARTPSVFRNAAGQEVAIDPKKGLTPESYPELTKEVQYTQSKKPLSQMRFQYGGTINYNGQYHEGPDGGVPVDNSGNYNPVNPVAMVEKGEVSYTGEDGNPYIFSDTLQLSKGKTFAKEAKGVQNKYRLRMKNGKVNDPIARKGYDLDMESLKSKQEELRDAMELMEEDEMAKGGWIQKAINPKHKGYCTPMTKSTCTPHRKALARRFKSGDLHKEYGGDLPMYWAGGTGLEDEPKGSYGWALDQNPSGFLVKPETSTAMYDLEKALDADSKTFKTNFINSEPRKSSSKRYPLIPVTYDTTDADAFVKEIEGKSSAELDNYFNSKDNEGWTPYSGAGWESAIGLAAPIIGNISNMIAARRNKGKYNVEVPEAHATPTPISLERERASAREQANVSRANIRRALKNGMSPQQYMANVGAAEAGVQRNLGNILGESYQREELLNSNLSQEERARLDRIRDMKLQADMYNSQLGMMEDAQKSQYLSNILNAINQWGADMSKSKQNAMYMQMLNPNIRIQQRPRYRSWMGRNFGPKDTRVWEDLND